MKYFLLILLFSICLNANAIDRFCNGAPTTIQANGGGNVALTAIVDASVFVGPNASVCEYATVFGTTQIRDNSRVYGKAQITDGAIISWNAEVYGNAVLVSGPPSSIIKVSDNAKVYGNASVTDAVTIKGSAKVFENSRLSLSSTIDETAQVYGSATATDTSIIKGSARLHGNAFVGSNVIATGTTDLCTLKNYGANAVLTNVVYCLQPPVAVPTVTSISLNSGPISGGTSVTIIGTNFLSGDSVFIGGATCSSAVVINPTTIQCITSAHAAGTVSVVVTNVDSKSGVLSNAYTYKAAPIIININPNRGVLAGGTHVTISGSNFIAGAVVNLNGTICTVTAMSATTIACTTSAHAVGIVSINVINPDGQLGTLPNAYTYRAAPTVIKISPKVGAFIGGTAVTVTGSNFTSGATVDFGGSPCANVSVISSVKISCTTSAHVAGSVPVSVINTDSQFGTLTNGYSYQGAPTIGSIVLNAGPLAGGNNIKITGTNFFTGVSVTIGGLACTSPTLIDPATIQCVAPPHAAGSFSVVVTNTDSQSVALINGYTYVTAPLVTSISPNGGSIGGGSNVVIFGNNFTAGATVNFSGANCVVITLSSTSITCTPSAHSAGATLVTVTNSDGQFGTLSNGYTYRVAPTVTSISPNLGSQAGGTNIIITGNNFIAGATVDLGGAVCGNINVVSITTITCTTTAHATGAVAVNVTNVDSQSGSLLNGYTYKLAPVINFISPNEGPSIGGTQILISVSNFITGATVSLDGVACLNVTPNGSNITCITPAHSAGSVNVIITNPDGLSGVLTSAFTYRSPPTVTSISPNNGLSSGGTNVTITGTGFYEGTVVNFGGSVCDNVLVVSSTSITCTTLAHAPATVIVNVVNADTQSGSLASAYIYREPITATLGSNVSTGNYVTCARFNTGAARCWGDNENGQLGYGDRLNRNSPGGDITLGSSVAQIETSHMGGSTGFSTCAVLDSGAVQCWGYNGFGQLGYGDTTQRLSPGGNVNLGGAATQVVMGYAHACALLTSGSVRCWGSNSYGELGYGNPPSSPVLLPGGDINLGGGVAIQISTSATHTCALLNTGTIRCWGENGSGQLGYGDTTARFSPGGDINLGGIATQISTGAYHTCALLNTGAVRCWGDASGGALGYGDAIQKLSPGGNIDLGGTATQISAGGNVTCALLTTGAIRCWGAGIQLGYGPITKLYSPGGDVSLGGIAIQVSVGNVHTCALLNTGAIRCWGNGGYGQLGYGNSISLTSPGGDITYFANNLFKKKSRKNYVEVFQNNKEKYWSNHE